MPSKEKILAFLEAFVGIVLGLSGAATILAALGDFDIVNIIRGLFALIFGIATFLVAFNKSAMILAQFPFLAGWIGKGLWMLYWGLSSFGGGGDLLNTIASICIWVVAVCALAFGTCLKSKASDPVSIV